MLSVRIFVSYATSDDPQGMEMAHRLITDLQAGGAEVITPPRPTSNHVRLPFLTRELIPFLTRELASCHALILIQTPVALQTSEVQATLQVALNRPGPQHILRFIAVPSELEEAHSRWEPLRAFDASQDYPRMREKVLVELGMISLDSDTDAFALEQLLSSKQSITPTAVPGSSRTSLLKNHTPAAALPSPDQGLDRPASLRKRPTLFLSKVLPGRIGVQHQQHTDHPASLPSSHKPFLGWRTFLSVFLATLLILAAGSLFYGKFTASHSTTHSLGSRPQPTNTPVPTKPVATEPTTIFFAQDTFQRPDQQGWGTASDGHVWGADATNTTHFSIQHEQGVITGGDELLNAILGQLTTNAEIFFTGSINIFKSANFGAILHWVNPKTFYKAYLDGRSLILLKSTSAGMSVLKSVSFPATANTRYDLRFRIQGTTLSARVWPANSPEPTQWMVTAQDASIQSGFGGLRFFLVPGVTITITAFQESVGA